MVLMGAAILAVSAAGCSDQPGPYAQGNAIGAINTLKSIAAAEVAFASSCGNGGYAATFKALTTTPPGKTGSFLAEPFSSAATAEKHTYTFRLAAGAGSGPGPADCHGGPTVTGYYASAEQLPDSSAVRAFATNEGNTVWELMGRKAPTEPFGPPAKPVQ